MIRRPRLPPWLSLTLSCALLTPLLTFHNVWPTLAVRPVFELSLDLTLLLLLLALWHLTGRRCGRGARAALTLVLLLLVVGRYLQVSAPALFGRELNLYWDAPHLPTVAAMTATAYPGWQVALSVAAVLATLALLWRLLALLLAQICDALALPGPRRLALLVCALGLGYYAVGRLSERLHYEHRFSLSVADMYRHQFVEAARAVLTLRALPSPPRSVAQIRPGGVDVLLLFWESYGAAVRDRAGFAAALDDRYRALADAADRAGWRAASAWLESTTFGGTSWLAHASVMSGSRIAAPDIYRQLLSSDRVTLSDRFRRAGYRSVALLPGLKKPWPEGVFYRYGRIIDAAAIGYPGPDFGWWAIPDQYSLAWLERVELERAGRAPLLVFFASVMSHSPFVPVPPYLDDWSRLASQRPYTARQLAAAERAAAERGDDGDYLAAMRYNLATLAGFLQAREGDALIIAVGDHQPPAFISGPDASWDVPAHVFSRDGARLTPFRAAGFGPGVRPGNAHAGSIETLHGLVLDAASAASTPSPTR